MAGLCIGKWLLHQDGAVKGFLRIVDGVVSEVCLGEPPEASGNSIVMPAFVNAHTHIGDSLAYPAPRGTVEEIVGPPEGYKHRVLRSVSRSDKIAAMTSSAMFMTRTGTTAFVDFREEGIAGVQELAEALTPDSPSATVLGRPTSADDTREEVEALLRRCDGFGMSALRDWPLDYLGYLSRTARVAGKMFAVHASETVREDVDDVIDLRPSYIVHMTSALEADLAECADAGVPIVVCPRSNEFFGLKPDIPAMLRRGVLVGLGTDNCMVSQPDMLEEVRAAYRVGRTQGDMTPLDAINLATYHGRKILSAHGNIATEIGVKDDLVVIRVSGEDPLPDLVTRARSEDIEAVIRRGRLSWGSRGWTR